MEPENHASSSAVGPETSDIHVRPLVALTFVLALVCVLSLWLTRRMLTSFEATANRLDTPVHPLAPAREIPPAPLLQEEPGRELTEYEQSVRRQLDTYGWVDRPQGIVHIPIERAIELTLERGLPAREAR